MVLHLKVRKSRSLPGPPSAPTLSLLNPPRPPPGQALGPTIAGWSSPVARQAHNLKVVGSNPTPATTLWLVDEPGAKRRLQGLPDDRADPGYFDRGWRDGDLYLPPRAGRNIPGGL